MANYSLVINSKFKPFTYQELMAPVKAMSDYHEKLADEYDKLSTQADILEAMGTNDRDKESGTYARYKSYSDALRQEADNLYRFGLNTESRQRLSELRRRYNTDIVPIQNAWNKREEEAKMQAKAEMEAAARGIDLRFSRRAADTALQNYVDNPNQTFRAITGQQITTEVANQFQGLAKQIQQDRNGNYWIGQKQLSPIEYAILTQKGMDYNQFADFINNPNDPSYSTIRGIVDSTLVAHGIQDFDPQTQADMFRYGAMGVSAGVGERGMQFHTDPYASKVLDAELSAELERRKQQLKATGEGGDGSLITSSYYELPMQGADYSSAGEQEEAMQSLGYTMKNGRLTYTGKAKVGDKEVSLYNSNGRIKTRQQFLQQATSDKEKKELGEYFDKMVDAGKTLGVYGNIYSNKELADQYSKLRDNNAAQMSRVLPLNYDRDAWNPTSRNFMVHEITGYRKGQPQFSTERMSLNDLLNKKDSNKNNLNIAAFWSDAQNQQGLILATEEDGKAHRYFIPADSMSAESNIKEAKELFDQANKWGQVAKQARTAKEKAEAERNSSMAREAAISKLHSGLTLENSSQKQSINYSLSAKQKGLAND